VGLVVGNAVAFLWRCGWCGHSRAAAHPVIASTGCVTFFRLMMACSLSETPLLLKRGRTPIAHQRHAKFHVLSSPAPWSW
jgi:hypothetical protein